MKFSEPVVEGIKQFIRTVFLGEIPVLIAVLAVIKGGINIDIGTFIIPWNIALAAFVAGTISVLQTSGMSALDKWIHLEDIKTPLDLTSLDSLKRIVE